VGRGALKRRDPDRIHVDTLAGVRSGIHYGDGVSIDAWTRCTGGLDIPEDGWPDSGTAIAVAFDGLPAGVYFVTAEAGTARLRGRAVVVR